MLNDVQHEKRHKRLLQFGFVSWSVLLFINCDFSQSFEARLLCWFRRGYTVAKGYANSFFPPPERIIQSVVAFNWKFNSISFLFEKNQYINLGNTRSLLVLFTCCSKRQVMRKNTFKISSFLTFRSSRFPANKRTKSFQISFMLEIGNKKRVWIVEYTRDQRDPIAKTEKISIDYLSFAECVSSFTTRCSINYMDAVCVQYSITANYKVFQWEHASKWCLSGGDVKNSVTR